MSTFTGYKCDGPNCQQTKKDANHWWLVDPAVDGRITVRPWEDAAAAIKGMLHLCGEQCLLTIITNFMREQAQWQRELLDAPMHVEAALPEPVSRGGE
jgi:hypothetical protein